MTVKLGIVSDLHLESSNFSLQSVSCDVLALLGDISVDLDILQMWLDRYCPQIPVLLIPGNHEYEGRRYDQALAQLKEAVAPFENVKVLQNEAIDIGSHRVLCSTLWTDFSGDSDLSASKFWAEHAVHEFSNTTVVQNSQKRKVRAFDYVERYEEAMSFIRAQCNATSKRVCVLSHFAPSVKSFKVYEGQEKQFVGFWASNTQIPENVEIWAHGHIHTSSDYMQGHTRIVANPRGSSKYPNLAQNMQFNPNFYIEL